MMRKTLSFVSLLALVGAFAAGCAGPERKFGRGMANTFEIVRGGEFRRTMEQTALFDGPDYAYSTGFFHGLNRTLARTGIGIYEVVTAPFPNPGRGYDPVCTDSFAPGPVYPDNYQPTLLEDSMFSTDTNLGFAGGDVMPFLPGSRFRIFDTH
jgi:putative exosortase-associated protein (TIGR04073 family)